jgi:TPR repeat protein
MKLLPDDFSNEKNRKMAGSLFQQSADSEDIEIYWRIAACYNKGIGVKKKREKAQIMQN